MEITSSIHVYPIFVNQLLPLPVQDRLAKRISSCEKRVKQMQEDESDTEFAESVKIHLDSWIKKCFFDTLISMGLLPADVPGDGNCALWSICALEAGCFIQTRLTTAERIRGVRQDRVIGSFHVATSLCSYEVIPYRFVARKILYFFS